MDLILLRPGSPESIFGADDSNTKITGDRLIGKSNLTEDLQKSFGQCIELVSIHQGMKQQLTTNVDNSARTSGRPVITEFACVKYLDETSVKLYEACLRAEPIGKGADKPTRIYILRNSGDKTVNTLTIELRDAMVSEIQFQSHPDDMPTEQFKLNFTEILWTYTLQNEENLPVGNRTSGWSISRNRPIGRFTDN